MLFHKRTIDAHYSNFILIEPCEFGDLVLQLLYGHVNIEALKTILGSCLVSFDYCMITNLSLFVRKSQMQGTLEANLIFL